MIISYSVSNFCSFDESAKISFVKTGGRQHEKHIIDRKYLSGAVIYGANASGKTSFLRSISFFKKLLLINDISSIDLQKYQFKFSKNEITTFLLEFVWDKNHYVYTVEVRPGAFVSEKYELCDTKKNKKLIFLRNGFCVKKGDLIADAWFKDKDSVSDKISYIKMLTSMGLDNVNGRGVKHINNLINFFKNVFFVSNSPKSWGTSLLSSIKAMPRFRNFLNILLRESDFGIDCIDFKTLSDDLTEQLLDKRPKDIMLPAENGEGLFFSPNSDEYYLFERENNKIVGRKLQVKVDGILFDFDQLSAGTRKMINMSIQLYLYKYDKDDTFLVMDELDCSLHSFVAKHVLQSLLNNENDNKSQILVSLHDTSLMDIQDIWRDDQIWFVKKDFDHSSKLYSLADFELRSDKRVSKDYLNGKFGAIPFLGANLFRDVLIEE